MYKTRRVSPLEDVVLTLLQSANEPFHFTVCYIGNYRTRIIYTRTVAYFAVVVGCEDTVMQCSLPPFCTEVEARELVREKIEKLR